MVVRVFVTKKSGGISLLTNLLTIWMLFVVVQESALVSSSTPTPIISWNSVGCYGGRGGVDLKRGSRWLSVKPVAVTAEKGEAAAHPKMSCGNGVAGGRGVGVGWGGGWRLAGWPGSCSVAGKLFHLHTDPCGVGGLIFCVSQFPKHAIDVQID